VTAGASSGVPNARVDLRFDEPWSLLHLTFSVLGGVVLLFIVAPLVGMVLATSGHDLAATAVDPEVRRSVWLTLWTSLAATFLLAGGAIPLAYMLARRTFPGRRLVLGLIDLPVVVPHSAAGIALLGLMARDAPLGRFGEAVGVPFVGGSAGIVLAMAYVSVPFLINAARHGFEAVPERLEKAAMNLGASPVRAFFTVSLPLAWRSILSGMVLMFARGLSEFGAVVIVAYHPMITPVLMYERFGAFGLRYARPVAVLFLGVTLLVFTLLKVLEWRQPRR
jgi:molybdate/tungstate transport system permease protein